MDPTQYATWVQFIREAGIIGVLCVVLFMVLVGGYRQWWVWGYQLVDMRQQRDEYRAIARGVTTTAEKAVDLAAMK